MDKQKVEMFLLINGKYFDSLQLFQIKENLSLVDDTKLTMLQSVKFYDPSAVLLISIFAGHFGIDRMYLGETGLGIAKLLTCGGLGIWTLIDWFLIMRITREKNLIKLQQI
jgi:TM2 domain-containing membrane protein YozV